MAPKYILYGNYFDNDTRTIQFFLEYAMVKFSFKEVDMFTEQKKESILELQSNNNSDNLLPEDTVPLLMHEDCILMGHISIFIKYLIAQQPFLEIHYPDDVADRIDSYMKWFQCKMRPCVKNLTKMILGPIVFHLK